MREFELPELGENIESAEVVRVLVAEGDEIEEEQNVLELETEKATIELPCPYGGRIAKIHVGEGDTISIGDPVLSLEDAEEEDASDDEPDVEKGREGETTTTTAKKAAKKDRQTADSEETDHEERGAEAEGEAEESRESPEGEEEARDSAADREEEEEVERERNDERAARPERRAPAGPGTRRLARELDVDLSEVRGTGSGGRITREDVKAHVRGENSRDSAVLPDFEQWGPVERRRLTSTMRAGARNLAISWQRIPHVTHHEVADITELEKLRRRYLERNGPETRITLTALALRVAATALEEDRRFNSSFDSGADEIIVKNYIHLGFAVDTEQGLVVPVIRDGDRKSVVQLAAEVSDLAQRAREGKLRPEELKGGTFTITNLGGIGGLGFTPIIRYPEVAILGLSRAAWRSADEGGPETAARDSQRRLMLPLSLSYDHRVINGADAARFAARIAALLADPTRWLFEG